MREPLPEDQALLSFTTSDGAVVEYILDTAVESDLPLLVYHHGTPGAGPISADVLQPARARGLRTVELVRPGYGGTRQPGRSVADNARLTAALVAHLGAERFASCGWSGGGPHTLADVHLLSNCVASVSIAGVAPFDEPEIDFLAGMGQDNLDEFAAALEPERLETYLSAPAAELAGVTNESLRDAMGSLLPPADLEHINASTDDIAAVFRWSVAHGIWGWYDDDIAFTQPWGFDVRQIRKPVYVLQGSEDLMVPFTHGQWLAATIPGARARLGDGEGHLSIAARYLDDAFRELAELLAA